MSSLLPSDLQRHPVWICEGDDVVPVDEVPVDDGRVFIVATKFTLRDGTEFDGFCSPCDPSGLDYVQPVIVTREGQLPFWWDDPPSEEPAAIADRVLHKRSDEIFPVRFVTRVACSGDALLDDVIDGFTVP